MPDTMKAAVLNAIGQALTMESVLVPEPGPDDVLVQTKACGICGTDLDMVDGRGYTPAPVRLSASRGRSC
jgi:S-(hydroxymethyl)mycothiol dehydrogenase